MIIGRDLMVQLGLMDNFNFQFLQWYGATIHMKKPRNLLGQSNITKHKMREVVMHTAEPASTQEDTERMVKILNSIYEKSYLKQVVNNASQLNFEERTLLLSLLKEFEDFFDGTLGNWVTEFVDLELNLDSKQCNNRYCLVPRINKEFL